MKNKLKLALGIIAVLGAGSVVAETIIFQSVFDEADLSSITGLTVDTPATSGADSGTVALDAANNQLAFTANAANMWTARQGAPIAWVAAPTVAVGETWFVETQVNMVDSGGTGDKAGWEQAGITFYDGTPGANPGDNAAPFLALNDWNNWNVVAQHLTVGGGGSSSVSPNLGTAAGAFLRIEITEGVATNTYNSFYKLNVGDVWTQLTGVAENRPSDVDNSAVGLFLKTHDDNPAGAAQFDYLKVGVVPEPATFGLVAVFGGAMLFIRRRFKR